MIELASTRTSTVRQASSRTSGNSAALAAAAAHAATVMRAQQPLRGQSLDIAIDDWNCLFHAVEERLKGAVVGQLLTITAPPAQDRSERIQVVVLECVQAFDQLFATLTDEREQRQNVWKNAPDHNDASH